MMSSNEIKTAAISYIFIVIPFFVMITVRLLIGDWQNIIMTSDWSIASAMIYSTCMFNVWNSTKGLTINDLSLKWFMVKALTLVSINIAIYCVMLLKPSFTAGIIQILIFFFATVAHFKYGRAVYRLSNKS
ncbi:hypothetical protein AYY26_15290 [Photobacterium phosphoreum]|uniref:hypothetical protein n=1 Tax=Photobacterium phosphoreum TaxID=659 RepID=UPI0007F96FCE|nr:hypothetical protein [Photobacterium phosphoreum]OBU45726.1 hypothetical protein AYY26_15290 [Photobacterium phosphoreum]